MVEIRHIEPDEDPVCGMRVDPESARAKGLVLTHEGRDYVFCGKGCMLDYRVAVRVAGPAAARPAVLLLAVVIVAGGYGSIEYLGVQTYQATTAIFVEP